MRLVAFLIGAVCGALELYLLLLLTRAVQSGATARVALVSAGKFFVLACAFVPVILFFRSDLLWSAIGLSCTLVVGACLRFLLDRTKQNKTDAQPPKRIDGDSV